MQNTVVEQITNIITQIGLSFDGIVEELRTRLDQQNDEILTLKDQLNTESNNIINLTNRVNALETAILKKHV